MIAQTESAKYDVRDYWENETCGTRNGSLESRQAFFESISQTRYALEPFIPTFAKFDESHDLNVLEIGVGAGSDFQRWINGGAVATGIDLTPSAIELTRERLQLSGADPDQFHLQVGDAENLHFDDDQFDVVYSWGVMHHSPNTQRCFEEAMRVLKPGGVVRAMIYHVRSWSCLMIWIWNALLKGKPFKSVRQAVAENLESPGTKVYTLRETNSMLSAVGFEDVSLTTRLGPGDVLSMKPTEKYQSTTAKLIWKIYPRWLIRLLGHRFGTFLLIEARKPTR